MKWSDYDFTFYPYQAGIPYYFEKIHVETQPDSYKIEQIKKMLAHETGKGEEHYGAHLTHWYGDTKPLTIDAGGLKALLRYYQKRGTGSERNGQE